MPSYTLLQMTQDILAEMDSDAINSINDNDEAQSVARTIRTAYNNLFSRVELVTNKILFNLTASTDPTQPVTMFVPPSIISTEWIRYDKHLSNTTNPLWGSVDFLIWNEFVQLVQSFQITTANDINSYTITVPSGTVQLFYRNNISPSYWSTPDDFTILFDSVDLTVDTTLQSSKTTCYGIKDQVFQLVDGYVIPLEHNQMMMLYNEAKSMCFVNFKGQMNPKAEAEARRQLIHVQRTKQNSPYNIPAIATLPDYGRRGGQSGWRSDNMIYWMRKGR